MVGVMMTIIKRLRLCLKILFAVPCDGLPEVGIALDEIIEFYSDRIINTEPYAKRYTTFTATLSEPVVRPDFPLVEEDD